MQASVPFRLPGLFRRAQMARLAERGIVSNHLEVNPTTGDFRATTQQILRNMNMPNSEIAPEQVKRSLLAFRDPLLPEGDEGYEVILQLCNERWVNRNDVQVLIQLINEMPAGFQLRAGLLNGIPLGALVEALLDFHGRVNRRRVLSGLFCTGVMRLFRNRPEHGPPRLRNVNEPGLGWYTPTSVTRFCYETSIFHFPLDKVVWHPSEANLEAGNFTEFLEAVENSPQGSDFSCYLFWDNSTIARLWPNALKSRRVRNRVEMVRTAGLANILFEDKAFLLNLCTQSIQSIKNPKELLCSSTEDHLFCPKHVDSEGISKMCQKEIYIPSGQRNCFLSALEYSLVREYTLRQRTEAERAQICYGQETGSSYFYPDVKTGEEIECNEYDLQSMVRNTIRSVSQLITYACKQCNLFPSISPSLKWKQIVAFGYLSMHLNIFSKYLYEHHDIYISFLYQMKDREGPLQNRITSLPTIGSDDYLNHPNRTRQPIVFVTLFQLNDQGEIFCPTQLANFETFHQMLVAFQQKESPSKTENEQTVEVLDAQSKLFSFSVLTHAITLWPSLTPTQLRKCTSSNHSRKSRQLALITGIHKMVVPYFKLMTQYSQLNLLSRDLIDYEYLEKLCLYQKYRHHSNLTQTLIFNPKAHYLRIHGKKQPPISRKRSTNQDVLVQNTLSSSFTSSSVLVFVYDLETVTNSISVASSDRVYEPFRQNLPPMVANISSSSSGERHLVDASVCYESVFQHQIPFSAQWAVLNLSDGGQFLQQKVEAQKAHVIISSSTAGILSFEDEVMILEEAKAYYPILSYAVPFKLKHETVPSSTTGEKIGDYFLKKPVTEYGGCLLGKCVEDMLLAMATYAYDEFGIQKAYCYAHNAAQFDHYILLAFQRFRITNLLKTPRGILSVTLRIPLPNRYEDENLLLSAEKEEEQEEEEEEQLGVKDGKKQVCVSLTFRDSRLFVTGSLKELCNGFNVPECWRKLSFPITWMKAEDCYHPVLREISKAYGENDIYALGAILCKLNRLIGDSPWKPSTFYHSPNSFLGPPPPICQFVTLMSLIRKSTWNHFLATITEQGGFFGPSFYPRQSQFRMNPQNPQAVLPKAIDIPALRALVSNALMGGRVVPLARGYFSPFYQSVLEQYLLGNQRELKKIYAAALSKLAYMQVLDVTSLYPYAQSYYPMPTGNLSCPSSIRSVSEEESVLLSSALTCTECEDLISSVHCSRCDALFSRCPECILSSSSSKTHLFGFIVVSDFEPPSQCTLSSFFSKTIYANLIGRKLQSPEGGGGIQYSFESTAQMNERFRKPVLGPYQCFTHYDLYWARRAGLHFSVVGGFAFRCSSLYRTFITTAFEQRIKAKQEGNKLMANWLKLNYNGAYGITCQSDIEDGSHLITLPEEKRDLSVLDSTLFPEIIRKIHLNASEYLPGESFNFPSGQTYVKKKKIPNLGECYHPQSPNQIGAAVLACARDVMNRIMFSVPPYHQTYTDTDSVALSGEFIETILKPANPHLVDNRPEAWLGTLKNDHLENNGTNPIILASYIPGKKVKVHITLNAEGELRIFPTFKGLQPSLSSTTTSKFSPEYQDYIATRSIFSIFRTGSCEDVKVTAWRKHLVTGVVIEDHMQQITGETYLRDLGVGTFLVSSESHGLVEYILPLGVHLSHPVFHSSLSSVYPIGQEIEGDPTSPWALGGSSAAVRQDRREKLGGAVLEKLEREMIEKYYMGAKQIVSDESTAFLDYGSNENMREEAAKIVSAFKDVRGLLF
jgi:hypothetical protein